MSVEIPKQAGDDKVREEIIAGAERVFERYGYARVSMQDISKECQKGRSTLYHYYDNKNEVLEAVAFRIISHIINECAAAISKDNTFAQNIETYFKLKLKHIRGLVERYGLLVDEIKRDPRIKVTKAECLIESEVDTVHQMIRWAIDRKEMQPVKEDDSYFLAKTLQMAFKSFEFEIIIYNRFPEFEQKLSWLSQILQKGLS